MPSGWPSCSTWARRRRCTCPRAKNSMRTLLRGAGVVPPRRPALWTKKGLEWLRRLELPTTSQQLRRDLLLEEIEALTNQVRRIEQQLNHQAGRSPAVSRLRTIPGVGVRTAEATWQALRRSPTVRAYFERVRRGDPQRKKIALVATAHYLVRVMWALLKRGTTWEEGVAPADEPEGATPAIATA